MKKRDKHEAKIAELVRLKKSRRRQPRRRGLRPNPLSPGTVMDTDSFVDIVFTSAVSALVPMDLKRDIVKAIVGPTE